MDLRLGKSLPQKFVLGLGLSLISLVSFAVLSSNIPFVPKPISNFGLSEIMAQVNQFSLEPIDATLKIDGIEGPAENGFFDLETFNWGINQMPTYGCGSAGTESAGKVFMQDFHFTMKVNKASPQLFLHCAEGNHFPKADLIVRKAGDPDIEFFKVMLSDVMITSYSVSGESGGEVPQEQITVNFGKIEMEYKEHSPEGTPGASTVGGWDLKKNKKI